MTPIDPDELAAFERAFDPRQPERPPRATVVGWGETSMVFRLHRYPDVVFKRVAGLRPGEEARYIDVIGDYIAALRARGVRVASTRPFVVESPRPVVYLAQPAMDGASLAHANLHALSDDEFARRLNAVFAAIGAVLAGPTDPRLGLDAQLSNWAADPDEPGALVYLDVTTPMMRDSGRERLDLGFVLRALPAPLVMALRASGKARSMLDRYYDERTAALDVVANLIKEQAADRLDLAVSVVNPWLRARDHRPLTVGEVRADYTRDARTWALLQAVRRPGRWVRTRVFRRPYDWVVPPRTERHPAKHSRSPA